jgi:hypothetical protein
MVTQSEDILYGISKLRGMHCTKNLNEGFPETEKEFRGLSPNSYIHVFVSGLYIPRCITRGTVYFSCPGTSGAS